MDRYYISEIYPEGKFYIWDKETERTIGNPIINRKRAIDICKWLNQSKLNLSI